MTFKQETPVENTQLCQAAAFGDVKQIKLLVKHGIDVNSCDELTGNTPLIWSVINSKFKVTKLLIRMGADIHLEAFNNKTAFDWAHSSNNSKLVPFFVNKMTKTRNSNGQLVDRTTAWKLIPAFIKKFTTKGNVKEIENTGTLVHDAAAQKTSHNLKTLLRKDVDVNGKNEHGETPLHTAVRRHRLSAVKLLINSSADVTIQDIDGATALHMAVANNHTHKCDEMIKTLVQLNDVSLYKENAVGNTPLRYAFVNNDIQSVKIICKSLPEDSSYAIEAMKLAIEFENIEIMKLLSKRWPQAGEWRDENNNTLIHCAVLKGNYAAVTELIDKVDINAVNDDGDTALHLTVERKLNEIVCFMLHNNVDVNVQNRQGDTALHLAVESNLLIFILLVEKCDKTIQNSDGNTAFHLAARYGKAEFIDLMISENKPKEELNLSSYDIRNLEFKNKQNNRNFTALHFACAENNHKIVEKLLEIDADTELKNNDGKTALDIAIEMNHFCMVSLFSGPKLCGNSLSMFVCPICMEIPIAPNSVYQCEEGHIYCGSCDIKSKVFQCLQCGVPIRRKQRHRDFENKLAIMFPNADLANSRANSFECLFEYN